MLKTLLKAAGLLAWLVWFSLASAATMGGINVISALGHPLKAEISLAELGKSDKSTISAKLASVDDFKVAGIDYPYSLPKLTFEVDTHANGDLYLKLSSTQPVNEPFVSLLVELSWPSGKLLHEYTFLLDPPGFVPEQPKAAEVKPVEPIVPVPAAVPVAVPLSAATETPPESAQVAAVAAESGPAVAAVESAEPAVVTAEKEVQAESAPIQAEAASSEMATPEQVLAQQGKTLPAEPVKMEPLAPTPQVEVPSSILIEKGDTLGNIAKSLKPVDVSLERMLVAMYRANAKKFDGKNMNRIRAGKILRMPEASEIAKVTQAAAVKEIHAQVADWQDYRQKLAATQSSAPEQGLQQESAGKISTAVAEKTPVAKESAKEVLRLSKGESIGDKTIAGGTKGKQEKLADKADDVTAQSRQAQEEQKKIAKLEDIKKDVNKLVDLKGQPVPQSEQKPLAASAPLVIKKPVAAIPAKATAPAGDDFDIMAMADKYLSMVLDDPMILGVVLAVILGLGGLGYFMVRRGKGPQKKTTKKNNEIGEVTGSWRTPVAPSPDTGDFTQSSAAAAAAAPMSVAAALDDVDPLSEADLFLNFGRDVQAEEILKDALSKTPSNVQLKLKLLSIYSNRKDVKSFTRFAQEIKDSGDTSAWERAAIMGNELDPDNPNYGGAKGEARHREPPKAEVDFDLGLDKAKAGTGSKIAAQDFKMDFDITAGQSAAKESSVDLDSAFTKTTIVSKTKPSADVDATSILSRSDVQAAEAATPMDFDISGILPGDVKRVADSTAMDFDLSGSNLEMPKPGAKGAAQSSSMMDFDLSGSNFESTAVTPDKVSDISPSSSAMNFNDLVFEIPTSQSKPAGVKPQAADTGMPFTIDFSSSATAEESPVKPAASGKLDIDFGNININLDEDTPTLRAGGEGKDEHWHEVATKLDLAKAYQEMGDVDGAREILEEVIRDGDVEQRGSAEKLMHQITA